MFYTRVFYLYDTEFMTSAAESSPIVMTNTNVLFLEVFQLCFYS
jgi:hypothetical protein